MASDLPFVAAAFFCERLLKEPDEVVSAIRIVDQVIAMGPDPGGPYAPVPISLTALISLKSAEISGEHHVSIRANMPDLAGLIRKDTMIEQDVPFFMAPGNLGTSSIIKLNMQLPLPVGDRLVVWFDVLFDGQEVTRMPLRLGYQIQEVSSAEPPETEEAEDQPNIGPDAPTSEGFDPA